MDELQGSVETFTGFSIVSAKLSLQRDTVEGTRGPGKTAAQLARFRRNVGIGYGTFWRGIIFDTEYKNLADIITQSKRIYRLFKDGARFLASASELRWVWPTGEELLFRFGKEADDYWDYHGQEFPFIGFNELTKQKTAGFYEAMFSCRRSSFRPEDYPLENGALLKAIPLETFSTTNPFGIGHSWVKKRFIEPAPRGTVIRETQKVFNPQTERDEDITLTRVAIHAMRTQWRTGINDPTGLDYNLLSQVIDLLNLTCDKTTLFNDIRLMEARALVMMYR